MQGRHFHADQAKQFYFEERCHITEWLNSSDDEAVSMARATVAPGITTRWHRLEGIAERYLVLSGEGRAEVEGMPVCHLVPGDVLLIPPGKSQRVSNVLDEPLVFLAVCTPRFRSEAYQDVDPEPLD